MQTTCLSYRNCARGLATVENPTFMPIRQQAGSVCDLRTIDRVPERSYRPLGEQLENILAKRAKVLVFTNLHSPSGAALTTEQMAGVLELADHKGVTVLSDEVYREMAYREVPKGAYELGESAISASSVTKLNGLRGPRIDWLIGPPEIARRVEAARMHASYRLPLLSASTRRRRSSQGIGQRAGAPDRRRGPALIEGVGGAGGPRRPPDA